MHLDGRRRNVPVGTPGRWALAASLAPAHRQGVLPVPLLVFLIWAAVYFARQPEPERCARFVRTFAFVVMLIVGGFFALFVAGEALTDPGGWAGVALVVVWALPLGALAVLGFTRPDQVRAVFVVLTGAVAAMTLWFVLDRHGWSSFEDRHGPVRTIASFALLFALSFYAWKRPWSGGWMMLIVSVLPLAVAARSPGFAAMALLNSTSALCALLFLWSASLAHQDGGRPLTGTRAT